MRTIVLITSHAPSLTSFRAPLIRLLHSQGVQVFALAPNFDESTRFAVQALGAMPIDCPMARTGMNPLRDAVNTWHMAKLLRRLKPDMSLGYFIKPVIFGTLAAWWAGVPQRFAMVEGLGFVFTPTDDGAFSFKRRLLKRLVLWLYKLGMSRAERVIFLNSDDQAELVASGVLPASKGFLLGGIGVDLEHWVPAPPVQQPPTFMLVARLLREKGVAQYAAAARIVKQKYPQTRFILLGGLDDNPGSITEADVQAWVGEGTLEWHGHTPVMPWMAQTSVYVLPSYREGVPVSTQEAMAMGRAVITTDVPGCRQTVMDGVNGFLVPPRDVEALAEKMQLFIAQPELIATMGQASRRIAEERFDVRKVNRRLVDLLLGHKPKDGMVE
ncbi:glycosyltransferase family 4 protein [Comamonas testosteroni]|uniref:Capsular glucan synthase n=1 Tax=Comamonas testosteroni TaxID=285 RepID=A0A8B4S901_COMTE|nr:glycosyltransferase family 4 protein [Comamonas testosteroni]QQN71624.1 glycosyltransferase family 4 protein [Comamonas testosteroni]SUY79724.1 Capsular glucan synthase [Comamonas testosteroni]